MAWPLLGLRESWLVVMVPTPIASIKNWSTQAVALCDFLFFPPPAFSRNYFRVRTAFPKHCPLPAHPNNKWTKVDVWLDHADRFKNGAIPQEAVETVTRDALLLNGLPSPRDSDARISLQHASIDSQGLQFDRSKLGVELEHLIRKELLYQ